MAKLLGMINPIESSDLGCRGTVGSEVLVIYKGGGGCPTYANHCPNVVQVNLTI